MSPLAKNILRKGERSACPITNTLDLLGDKWTLLVVRDMLFLGKGLFGEFLESAEGISTNILADRLKRLEQAGVVDKQAYQDNPIRHRYRLTEAGLRLRPVLIALIEWGSMHIEGVYVPRPGDLEGDS